MAWKNLTQRSLADGMLIEHDALKELDGVHELIDWSRLEQLLSGIHASPRGEKAWPPLMMVKALLLQSWYGLSDPALEKQLARDLLFRRFTGLDISESVPDHTTLWRFRQTLERLSLMDACLGEINTQLSEQGLYIQSGGVSIVDASVIEAKPCRPYKGRPHKNQEGHSTQDPEASWNVKAGSDGKRKSTYGYKAHINVDEDGFIKSTDYSPGNVHDSNCFTDLLGGDETAVYADSAYRSRAHDQWLAERQIDRDLCTKAISPAYCVKNVLNRSFISINSLIPCVFALPESEIIFRAKVSDNRVIKRGYRNKPLDAQGRKFNRLHSGVRCTVERVFGVLKLHYGMGKARYLGLGRNRTRFELMCVAHNIKRGLSLQQASCA